MYHNSDDRLVAFRDLFNELPHPQARDLSEVYAEEIRFQDPFVKIHGSTALEQYFRDAYSNVISCNFDFGAPLQQADEASQPWLMRLRHRRLKGGEEVRVEGISYLQFMNDRVVFHRDYFDAGQLLYENIPLLGTAVKWIRRYAA